MIISRLTASKTYFAADMPYYRNKAPTATWNQIPAISPSYSGARPPAGGYRPAQVMAMLLRRQKPTSGEQQQI